MCFSEFASLYKTSSKPPSTNDARSNDIEDTEDDQQSKHILLKDNMGHMHRRKTPAIIRNHQWSLKKQPQQCFHFQLVLYFPWRKEGTPAEESYAESYNDKLDVQEFKIVITYLLITQPLPFGKEKSFTVVCVLCLLASLSDDL